MDETYKLIPPHGIDHVAEFAMAAGELAFCRIRPLHRTRLISRRSRFLDFVHNARFAVARQPHQQRFNPPLRATQLRQDFLENLVVEVRLPLAGFPCSFIRSSSQDTLRYAQQREA